MSKHTPGPWYRDNDGYIWRRPLNELYEYGGRVAGDKPVAAVWKGWDGEDQIGYPVEANACLIAAAPEMLELLRDVRRYVVDANLRSDGYAEIDLKAIDALLVKIEEVEMSEPIYYHYRCSYPPCHAIHAEPDQAAACHGEEAESVYQCGRCERAHERQGEAEECCIRSREPLPDQTERSITAAAINRGTW